MKYYRIDFLSAVRVSGYQMERWAALAREGVPWMKSIEDATNGQGVLIKSSGPDGKHHEVFVPWANVTGANLVMEEERQAVEARPARVKSTKAAPVEPSAA